MRGVDALLADVLEASSDRAYGDAGPPNRALFIALGVGLLAALAMWTAAPMVDKWVLIGIGVGGVTGLVALTDREGWRTRQGMAYLATQQLTRWPDRPSSTSEARDWLADPKNDGAPPLRRASVQTHAGDLDAAEATIASFQPDSEIDLVGSWEWRSCWRAGVPAAPISRPSDRHRPPSQRMKRIIRSLQRRG